MNTYGKRRFATVVTFGWRGRLLCTPFAMFPMAYVCWRTGLFGLLTLGIPTAGLWTVFWMWHIWWPRGERCLNDEELAQREIERAMRDTSPSHQAFAPRSPPDPSRSPATQRPVDYLAPTSATLHPGLVDPRSITPV